MNHRKLKAKLVELDKTYSDCSQAIGINLSTFSKKMNGESNFYIHEINRLAEYLQLTDEEKVVIFMS